jgi:hypothetical protein
MTTGERLEALEARVRALEDERAIVNILHAYAHALDYDRRDVFAGLWTATATLAFNFDAENRNWPRGTENLAFEGHERIMEFFGAVAGAPEVYHKHLVVDPSVSIDGDRAVATSYYARLEEAELGPVVASFGRYHDDLVRGEDGVWRIEERRGFGESRVSVRR